MEYLKILLEQMNQRFFTLTFDKSYRLTGVKVVEWEDKNILEKSPKIVEVAFSKPVAEYKIINDFEGGHIGGMSYKDEEITFSGKPDEISKLIQFNINKVEN